METEKFELMLDEAQANAALEKGMLYADTFVNKNYLINLDRYPLVELDPAEKSDEYIRLYQIERIVYDVDENANDKLISVYSAFFNIQAAGLLVIKSTRNALGFYIGVRSVDNTSTAEAILEKSFKGNFAGSQIQAIPQEEVQKVLGSINKSGRFGTRQNVSSVSIVPSTRDEDKERFVQGIEKFIDTMKGSEYTAVFIAEPLDKEILEQRKRGLQKIYSGLSPFASTQLSYGENYSKAVSKGMSENFSKTLNDSLTDTTSHFNSRSTSRSHGTSFGFLGIGFNNSTSTGYSSGSSWASAVTRGTSETKGETVTETDTDTTGDSRTITVTSENKSVKYILEKIDQHLARIKNCEAFGLWDIACYFVSENVQTSVVAASTYKALMAGFDSGVENSYVNVWKQDNTENTPALLEYLRYCIHPRFSIPGDDQFFEVESQTVNPCSLISGNEMPYIMGLPHHSVPGVTVLNMAEFGRNVRFSSGAPRGKKVELGQVYHMGEKETARVKLNLESFRSHCFITGSTGSGNSLTAYQLMLKLPNEKIGRRIYVYDISGEMFSSSSDVQNNLAYSYANGFIFIIDPLTLNQFAMDVEDKVDLNAYGASSKDFDDILNIMLINLEKMFGLKDKDTLKRNLAVVINKVDIPTLEEKIGETAAQQYLAENAKTCKSYMDARDAVCRNFLEEYGAGNFVRTAEAKFKTVRYFTCSALGHNHEGQPYEGKNVVDPVMWLLQQADSSIKAE